MDDIIQQVRSISESCGNGLFHDFWLLVLFDFGVAGVFEGEGMLFRVSILPVPTNTFLDPVDVMRD